MTTCQSSTEVCFSVYTSFESLDVTEHEWDQFVLSVSGEIYMTYDWCKVWWDYYGKRRKLLIYVFRSGSQIVGILPLFMETIWLGPTWIKMVKTVGSDFTMTMPNPPVQMSYSQDIFRELIIHLFDVECCDALWLGPLTGLSFDMEALRTTCAQQSARVRPPQEKIRSPYTEFALPETFEDYLSSLDKRQRGNYRRDLNLLNKTFEVQVDAVDHYDSEELMLFRKLHEQQWEAEGKLGHFKDWPMGYEFNRSEVETQAAQNRFRMVRLKANGTTVSYQLCFVWGSTLYWRLPARISGSEWDRYGLGRLGLITMIEWAISQGIRRIEAGAGHYEYKVKSGGREFPLYTILIARNGWWSRFRVCIFRLLSELIQLLYCRIWFYRIAPKLPFQRRPLWKLWIRTRL